MEQDQRIDSVAKDIFSSLLVTMESKEVNILENHDVESLHEFRVALRRTRALLQQLKGVFPQATIRRFKREFDWLGNASGTARDLDVYLYSFDKFTFTLGHNRQKDLASLQVFLSQYRQEEQSRVIKILASRRYQNIKNDWKKFIYKPVPVKTSLLRANNAVFLVASESIWHSYRKILNKGKRVGSGPAANSLHELRKACKNLRYLIEFFQDMYPRKKIQVLLEKLKSLQNTLGEYQDLQVQQYFVNEYVVSLKKEVDSDRGNHKSMKILINKLDKHGGKVRKKFDNRFEDFGLSKNQKLYKKLFKQRA
jgi:CHAD domain-containing protein